MRTTAFMIISLLSAAPCLAGNRCTVTDFSTFERPGIESSNGFYYQVVERCARTVILNTGDSPWFATDIHVTAFFEDGEKRIRTISGEEDRLQKVRPDATYSAAVCFGQSPSIIVKMDCAR